MADGMNSIKRSIVIEEGGYLTSFKRIIINYINVIQWLNLFIRLNAKYILQYLIHDYRPNEILTVKEIWIVGVHVSYIRKHEVGNINIHDIFLNNQFFYIRKLLKDVS